MSSSVYRFPSRHLLAMLAMESRLTGNLRNLTAPLPQLQHRTNLKGRIPGILQRLASLQRRRKRSRQRTGKSTWHGLRRQEVSHPRPAVMLSKTVQRRLCLSHLQQLQRQDSRGKQRRQHQRLPTSQTRLRSQALSRATCLKHRTETTESKGLTSRRPILSRLSCSKRGLRHSEQRTLLKPPVPLRSSLASPPRFKHQVLPRTHHLLHLLLHLNHLLAQPLMAVWAMALRASVVINLKSPFQTHSLNQRPYQQPNPLRQLPCKPVSLLPLRRRPAEHSALSQVFSWVLDFRRSCLQTCPVSKHFLHRSPQPPNHRNPCFLATVRLPQARQASSLSAQAGVTLKVSLSSSTIVTRRKEKTRQCTQILISRPLLQSSLGPFPASRPIPRPHRVQIHRVRL